MLASFLVVLVVVPLIFAVVVPALCAYFWIQRLYRPLRSVKGSVLKTNPNSQGRVSCFGTGDSGLQSLRF